MHALKRFRWGMRRVPRQVWPHLAATLARRAFTPEKNLKIDLQQTARVIFVCHGNIMRSAFANAYWQTLQPTPTVTGLSAGTDARVGRAAHPTAIQAARALGVSLTQHAATPAATLALLPGDLMVGFDIENEVQLRELASTATGVGVLLLGDLGENAGTLSAEIRDPWGTELDATIATFSRIASLVRTLSERIASRAVHVPNETAH